MKLDVLYVLARKLSAISFIALILIGHFWLLQTLLGQTPGLWMQWSFIGGVVGALVGGIILALLTLFTLIKK